MKNTKETAKAEAQYANAPAAMTASKTTPMTKEEKYAKKMAKYNANKAKKEERYAKKMAKYEANKAKKEQRKKEEAEKLWNELFDLLLHNDKSGTCSLTGVHYDNYGNNAYPFDGRCCDDANIQYVLPARILKITPEQIHKSGKESIMEMIDKYNKEGQFKFLEVPFTATARKGGSSMSFGESK